LPERVLLQPSPAEYGLHRRQYDALVEDLEAEGVLVRVLPAVEEHVFPTSTVGEFYDLVVHVGQVAGAIVGRPKLIEIVRRRLRGRESRRVEPRRGKVYLANGEEHEFILDAEDE
jgi:hypothetical protein